MTTIPPEAATEPFLPRALRHLADLLRLAWPVMLSRAGILVMAFCDIAMLGLDAGQGFGQIHLVIALAIDGSGTGGEGGIKTVAAGP